MNSWCSSGRLCSCKVKTVPDFIQEEPAKAPVGAHHFSSFWHPEPHVLSKSSKSYTKVLYESLIRKSYIVNDIVLPFEFSHLWLHALAALAGLHGSTAVVFGGGAELKEQHLEELQKQDIDALGVLRYVQIQIYRYVKISDPLQTLANISSRLNINHQKQTIQNRKHQAFVKFTLGHHWDLKLENHKKYIKILNIIKQFNDRRIYHKYVKCLPWNMSTWVGLPWLRTLRRCRTELLCEKDSTNCWFLAMSNELIWLISAEWLICWYLLIFVANAVPELVNRFHVHLQGRSFTTTHGKASQICLQLSLKRPAASGFVNTTRIAGQTQLPHITLQTLQEFALVFLRNKECFTCPPCTCSSVVSSIKQLSHRIEMN